MTHQLSCFKVRGKAWKEYKIKRLNNTEFSLQVAYGQQLNILVNKWSHFGYYCSPHTRKLFNNFNYYVRPSKYSDSIKLLLRKNAIKEYGGGICSYPINIETFFFWQGKNILFYIRYICTYISYTKYNKYYRTDICIHLNPLPQLGCKTRSIFKQFNMFEFRVFLLQDWLTYQDLRTQPALLFYL